MLKHRLKFGNAVLWAAVYFGVMVFYTFLDIAVWRKYFPAVSDWINIIVIMLCVSGFVALLKKTGYQIKLLSNITPTGIFIAVGCSLLFFLLLDNCLDPAFESIFPKSEQDYQKTLQSLINSPITSLIQVCLIAPVIEEILMRGFVFGGLKHTYGTVMALLFSSLLFALLHFNMVQTLSAFVCGVILGLLYIRTNSIFCCILAHCGYNFISYIMTIYPYINNAA